jgi:hypothetical protein
MALLFDMESTAIYFDATWKKAVRDKFCRKESDIEKKDNLFFAQYWQGFAWAAVLGFLNNRRIPLDPKTKDSSFKFGVIRRNGPSIAEALILMAIAKSEGSYEIFEKPTEIALIISEYATGGATIINEIRETPGSENKFDFPDDFLSEIEDRK